MCNFLHQSYAAIGSNSATVAELQKLHLDRLKTMIRASSPTLEESTAALEFLAQPSTAFGEAQRRELSAMVVQRSVSESQAARPSTVERAQLQTHVHLHNYFTKTDWESLRSGTTFDVKVRATVDRMLGIGLTNPSEPTVALVMTIVDVATGVETSLKNMKALKDHLKLARRLFASKVGPTRLRAYPKTVPPEILETYKESDPPVDCPLSVEEIVERHAAKACRRSHKTAVGKACATVEGNSKDMLNNMAAAFMHGMTRQSMPRLAPIEDAPVQVVSPRPLPLALKGAAAVGDAPAPTVVVQSPAPTTDVEASAPTPEVEEPQPTPVVTVDATPAAVEVGAGLDSMIGTIQDALLKKAEGPKAADKGGKKGSPTVVATKGGKKGSSTIAAISRR